MWKKNPRRENLPKRRVSKSRLTTVWTQQGKSTESKSNLAGTLTSIAAFVSLMISVPLGFKSLYDNFKTKSDELSIRITSYEPDGKYVNIGVVYDNTGDYSEVINGVTSSIGVAVHGYSAPMTFEQGRCIKPILLKPNETAMVRYRVLFDTNDEKIPNLQEMDKTKFSATLNFDIVNRKRGVMHAPIYIGDLKPWREGPFKGDVNYEFETIDFPVNFSIGAPRITLGTYPQSPEFVLPDTCGSSSQSASN
ncbi:hypothetical protein [Paraburkholderia caribensis]|uniref:hypothetical protein n=1 Tax=Paraburkholderia caribensis TaxID=75105 RepID=UPI00285F563C|nr:hypothetical protein [Paraburkholderia caribensis]MDR6383999.1 hypothetical protein [Paraburkholderia caribensis]